MATARTSAGIPAWNARSWLFAGLIPLVFLMFEGAAVLAYPATRAPNVGVAAQLAWMALFFFSWLPVPRLLWQTIATNASSNPLACRRTLLRILAFGLAASAVHLLLLSLVLRILHSPPGWGVSHLAHSFGEVWLGRSPQWLSVYALVSVVLLVLAARRPRPTVSGPPRLLLQHNGRKVLIPYPEIRWLRAEGNYTVVVTASRSLMVRRTLGSFEKELSAAGFLRSHRGALVNAAHVRSVRKAGAGAYVVELADGIEAPLSRRRLGEFTQTLKAGDVDT